MSGHAAMLSRRIGQRTARVGVIGLGYVGLPLAVALAEAGFEVVGMDIDEAKVARINAGSSPIEDVDDVRLGAVLHSGTLAARTGYDSSSECDAVFVCVPTPFDRNKTPDLRAVRAAAEGIAEHLRPGQLIILESTTYPGTTEEIILPRLESGGLRVGVDFHLAFSPERIDPGVSEHTVQSTPKVVGGVTPDCTRLAGELLAAVGTRVHPVSGPRVAEMTKLLENIFRSVNIALVNELALLCERMGIDVWEVIDAAATKPFGFMPFRPGAGVGGHCIPVDPYYLAWKAREYDFPTRFIELAAEVNQRMPGHVVDLVERALDGRGVTVRGARVLVLGVAFKPNVSDPRNAPAERIVELLLERGADVDYHDRFVPEFTVGGDAFRPERTTLLSVPLDASALEAADAVLIAIRHDDLDVAEVCRAARLVIDACNATANLEGEHIVRLGAPAPAPPARTEALGERPIGQPASP